MTLFSTVVLHKQDGPDPVMRQKVSARLAKIGLERSVAGDKGPVLLPMICMPVQLQTESMGNAERKRLAIIYRLASMKSAFAEFLYYRQHPMQLGLPTS